MSTDKLLSISKDLAPSLTQEEANKFAVIFQDVVLDYVQHKDKLSLDEWLRITLAKNLQNTTSELVQQESQVLLDTLKIQEENYQSLQAHLDKGLSVSSWFAKEMRSQTEGKSLEETQQYINTMAQAIEQSNKQLFNQVNMRASLSEMGVEHDKVLDGADNLVALFNHDAAQKNSDVHAEVDRSQISEQQPYGKINIIDGQGKVIDSCVIKYEDKPDNEQEWLKNSVFTRDLEIAQVAETKAPESQAKEEVALDVDLPDSNLHNSDSKTATNPSEIIAQPVNLDLGAGAAALGGQLGLDPERVKQVLSSVGNSEQLATSLSNLALDKGAELVSDQLGLDQSTVEQVLKGGSSEAVRERLINSLQGQALKKGVELVGSNLGVNPEKIKDLLEVISGPECQSGAVSVGEILDHAAMILIGDLPFEKRAVFSTVM